MIFTHCILSPIVHGRGTGWVDGGLTGVRGGRIVETIQKLYTQDFAPCCMTNEDGLIELVSLLHNSHVLISVCSWRACSL